MSKSAAVLSHLEQERSRLTAKSTGSARLAALRVRSSTPRKRRVGGCLLVFVQPESPLGKVEEDAEEALAPLFGRIGPRHGHVNVFQLCLKLFQVLQQIFREKHSLRLGSGH